MKHLLTVSFAIIGLAATAVSTAQPSDQTSSAIGQERRAAKQNTERKPFKTQFIVGANLLIEAPFEQQTTLISGGAIKVPVPVVDFGASFEARFTRHSGIESGIYYRNILRPGFTFTPHDQFGSGEAYAPKQFSHYITIPVLYKFYSRIVNVSAGINYSRLLEQTTTGFNPERDRAKDNLGLMIKVSKDIKIYKRLLIEPFIQYEHEIKAWPQADDRINHRMNWLGGGIGVKYTLSKGQK